MKQSKLKGYLAICITCLFIITAASCNNNDTSDATTTTTSDTGTMMKIDSSGMIADTTLRNQPVNTDVDTSGTSSIIKGNATPNPAKRGMKGKATVTAATRSNASMEADATGVYANAEYLPTFPGGVAALQRYFNDQVNYPSDASNEGIEGTVNVSFIVDETGKLSSPQIVGERMGYGLEDEALRVIRSMPDWNPGKLKGKNVKTRYTLPVRFSLY